MERTVHILKHGATYCGQDIIVGWPEGHVWVAFNDEEHLDRANCAGCLEKFDKDKRVVEGVMGS